MHALHPHPTALITALPYDALEEACRLDDEEQEEEKQPEEHHRIEPPEVKLRKSAPEIEPEQHIEAGEADEQHGDSRLRSEAALEELEDGARIVCTI